jgi:hypothetical protein
MKKPQLADGLSKLKEVSGRAPAPAEQPTPQSATDLPPSRVGKVAISAYFDKAVRKQLANLATHEEKSQAALMAEALNLLFEKYGQPPIARA